jgi:hypothetical protein
VRKSLLVHNISPFTDFVCMEFAVKCDRTIRRDIQSSNFLLKTRGIVFRWFFVQTSTCIKCAVLPQIYLKSGTHYIYLCSALQGLHFRLKNKIQISRHFCASLWWMVRLHFSLQKHPYFMFVQPDMESTYGKLSKYIKMSVGFCEFVGAFAIKVCWSW